MACSHLSEMAKVAPTSEGCEECLARGDRWVHLRVCLGCGHVGCCDSSKNRHASAHYRQTGHPLIQAFQPGEGWGWCFIDECLLPPGVLSGLRPATAAR